MTGKEIIKEWEDAQESGTFCSYEDSMEWLAKKIDDNKRSSTDYYEDRISQYERDHQDAINMYKDQDLGPVWS